MILDVAQFSYGAGLVMVGFACGLIANYCLRTLGWVQKI